MVKVFPGEFYVTSKPDEMLVTVLGSCVAACIRDPRTGIGGMNHFMLPQGHAGGWGRDPESTRFGNFAMEKLINELIKAGCARERSRSRCSAAATSPTAVRRSAPTTANSSCAISRPKACAARRRISAASFPRRIHYFPATGKSVRRLLGGGECFAVVARGD